MGRFSPLFFKEQDELKRKRVRMRAMAENSIAQEKVTSDFASLPVIEISANEYNRVKNKKGQEFLKNTPAFFVIQVGDDTLVYITVGGRFYKSETTWLSGNQRDVLLGDQKLNRPEVGITINFVVTGSKWDNMIKEMNKSAA